MCKISDHRNREGLGVPPSLASPKSNVAKVLPQPMFIILVQASHHDIDKLQEACRPLVHLFSVYLPILSQNPITRRVKIL